MTTLYEIELIFSLSLFCSSDLNTTVAVASPFLDLLGVGDQDREFFISSYLPELEAATQSINLTSLERAELLENTLGTVVKLLYAFVWQVGGFRVRLRFVHLKPSKQDAYHIPHSTALQEEVIDLSPWNLTPEANAFGAALLPHINEFGNNLTRWDLSLEELQVNLQMLFLH